MEEQKISQETAKLAMEKGLDQATDYLTSTQIKMVQPLLVTQSALQRWLRDEHQLHIEVKVKDYVVAPSYYWSIFGKHGTMTLIRCIQNSGEIHDERFNSEEFPTYEKALEDALVQALKRIN